MQICRKPQDVVTSNPTWEIHRRSYESPKPTHSTSYASSTMVERLTTAVLDTKHRIRKDRIRSISISTNNTLGRGLHAASVLKHNNARRQKKDLLPNGTTPADRQHMQPAYSRVLPKTRAKLWCRKNEMRKNNTKENKKSSNRQNPMYEASSSDDQSGVGAEPNTLSDSCKSRPTRRRCKEGAGEEHPNEQHFCGHSVKRTKDDVRRPSRESGLGGQAARSQYSN